MHTQSLKALFLGMTSATLVSTSLFAQGDLTPPGAPAPSMRTLVQVEPRIPVDASNTPGDTDSVYLIKNPGSYYLTGNLTWQPRSGIVTKENGIQIAASGVTLDLNGFRISGGANSNSLSGIIISSSAKNIVIKNGTIADWELDGIRGNGVDNVSLEDVTLDGNDANGVVLGDQINIRNVRAINNATNGIAVNSFATIADCQARSNGKGGIVANTRCVITRCTVGDSGGDGIIADDFCVVSHCTVYNAFGWGIKTTSRPEISHCVVDNCGHIDVNNLSGGILLHYAGQVRNCTISLNRIGIEILGTSDGGGCIVADNEIDSNTGGGIDVLSGLNRIEGNMLCCNGGPAIRTHDHGNFLFRNTIGQNNGASPDLVLGGADTVGPTVTGAGSTGSLAGGSNPYSNFQR